MSKTRRSFGASFEAKVALSAVRGVKTASELASEFGVHPTMIAKWKKLLLDGAAEIFSRNGSSRADDFRQREAELYQQIGKLQMELQWLKKRLPASTEAKRSLVEPGHETLSVRRQCELLRLPRTSWYRRPAGESAENLELMRLIDEQYLRTPFYGSRNMTWWLNKKQGRSVNRKRGRRETVA